MGAKCNCESSKCDHTRACERPAGSYSVMYIGAVCAECFEKTPPMYWLGPKVEPEAVIGTCGECGYRGAEVDFFPGSGKPAGIGAIDLRKIVRCPRLGCRAIGMDIDFSATTNKCEGCGRADGTARIVAGHAHFMPTAMLCLRCCDVEDEADALAAAIREGGLS